MNNKAIFAIATQVTKDLKAIGLTTNTQEDKQSVYTALRKHLTNIRTIPKPTNNTNQTSNTDNKDTKEGLNKNNKEGFNRPQSKKEGIRARLEGLLEERLDAGTLSAADIGQLKDVYGLTADDAPLTVEVINYKDLRPECVSCPVLLGAGGGDQVASQP